MMWSLWVDGIKKRPAILHIAVLGSVERFIAILLENYAGAFPLWLSPLQVKVIPIADRHNGRAEQFVNNLKKNGIRAEVDSRSESMQKKIREAQIAKANYMAIIGDKEVNENSVSIRKRSGENIGSMSVDSFLSVINEEISNKSLN